MPMKLIKQKLLENYLAHPSVHWQIHSNVLFILFYLFLFILFYFHNVSFCFFLRASGILDSAKWNEFLVKPSLPYILRILTGLINGHQGTQVWVWLCRRFLFLH